MGEALQVIRDGLGLDVVQGQRFETSNHFLLAQLDRLDALQLLLNLLADFLRHGALGKSLQHPLKLLFLRPFESLELLLQRHLLGPQVLRFGFAVDLEIRDALVDQFGHAGDGLDLLDHGFLDRARRNPLHGAAAVPDAARAGVVVVALPFARRQDRLAVSTPDQPGQDVGAQVDAGVDP